MFICTVYSTFRLSHHHFHSHISANLFTELITKFRSIHIFKQLDRQIQQAAAAQRFSIGTEYSTGQSLHAILYTIIHARTHTLKTIYEINIYKTCVHTQITHIHRAYGIYACSTMQINPSPHTQIQLQNDLEQYLSIENHLFHIDQRQQNGHLKLY